MNKTSNEKWADVCHHICTYEDVNKPEFIAFAERMVPQVMSEGYLLITVESDFLKRRVEQNLLPVIKRALSDLYNVPFVVEVDINPGQEPHEIEPISPPVSVASPVSTANTSSTEQIASAEFSKNDSVVSQKTSSPEVDQPADSVDMRNQDANASTSSSNVLSSLTFENFVIGDSNRMAYSMALSVAETPGIGPLNPLFIHSHSGLGKTHLMRAIQNYVNETRPNLVTVYADTQELVSSYSDASLAKDINKSSFKNFKDKYESADVLLLDDVQYLQDKAATLNIFFQIFNKLVNQGKQVVLSADRAPKNIDVDERYRTRFMQGGVIDIQPPEVETKLAIVRSYINEFRSTYPYNQLNISEEIQIYIAENSGPNIRELKGAINSVISKIIFEGYENITVKQVESLLEIHFSRSSKNLSVENIQKVVEDYYRIKHSDMIGDTRSRDVVYPRHTAIYLCKVLLDQPLTSIAKKFNRNHATAIYSINKVEEMLRSNRNLHEEVEILKKKIKDL